VRVERGAGDGASIPDAAYETAGAVLASSPAEAVNGATILLKVQVTESDLSLAASSTLIVGHCAPFQNAALLKDAAAKSIALFSMEMVPRITRAQAMDALSSQSNLAGYKAVLDAAGEFTRAFPMMMTAAGTIAPARVFVMGAGVAGLQAIATAKRLGRSG
jgi:H+-translocating NAD(P) transhydrogenase subunit alpha